MDNRKTSWYLFQDLLWNNNDNELIIIISGDLTLNGVSLEAKVSKPSIISDGDTSVIFIKDVLFNHKQKVQEAFKSLPKSSFRSDF